ncbi:type II CAAX prenyl endopeptidase Rce1 family protein [Actinoplanes sp. NPDC049265]|uniref:CPBP family glutamic-type intramembrane protease n=1 Tax=Actinoplanes sp. NPDC049265 TaxID=3363902 RepID=UPI003719D910
MRRAWLTVEFLLLFFGVVGAYAALGRPSSPIPPLLLLGLVALLWLRRRPGFDRGNLLRPAGLHEALPTILITWAVAAVAGIVVVAVVEPAELFDLPRTQTLLWVLIIVLYPLLSVYPQELIYRAFLLHRYEPILGRGRLAAAASAAAFGFAYIIFGAVASVLLTLAGGWLFARRYQRTRSLLAASVEHALYGVLAFTIGLGDLFYHGAVR